MALFCKSVHLPAQGFTCTHRNDVIYVSLDVVVVCFTRCVCVTVQVDLVCHGKTEVFPDKDGSDPYAVSTASPMSLCGLSMLHMMCKYAVGPMFDSI